MLLYTRRPLHQPAVPRSRPELSQTLLQQDSGAVQSRLTCDSTPFEKNYIAESAASSSAAIKATGVPRKVAATESRCTIAGDILPPALTHIGSGIQKYAQPDRGSAI
jgi:hypothetical protein